jgi:predicted ATP-grasp superfamily ATP-dependent carboligase
LPDSGAAILIAAISGRALAASARRGGYLPLVTDFFGDQDTLAAAHAHVRLAGDLASGIDERDLFHALETLSEQRPPAGIVCGTGFEMRTHLLERLAQRWRLFGNNAETVAKVKNPEALSAMCAGLGIPFPELSLSPPRSPADWLVKRRGGAGGGHVKPALQPHSAGSADGDMYYQRKMSGTPIAALFVSNGERAVVLGFSAQWSSPTPRQPYRYGGAVRPANLAAAIADRLDAAVRKLAAAFSLVGLNSADFLVDGESIWLLEINPRPGATLDIFEPLGGSLFALHMAACRGKLFAAPHHPEGAKASAIVYAENDIPCVPTLDWPDWSADRPAVGSTIKAGEPVCTVYACSQDVCSQAAAAARAIVDQRREMILAWTRAGGNHEGPAPDQCE